jgi:hypothetical protein
VCPIIRSVIIPRFSHNCGMLRMPLPIRGCARAATWVRRKCGQFHEPRPESKGHPLELSGAAQSQFFKESFSKGLNRLDISRQWTSSPSQRAKIMTSTMSMITRTGTSYSGLIAPYHFTSHRQRGPFAKRCAWYKTYRLITYEIYIYYCISTFEDWPFLGFHAMQYVKSTLMMEVKLSFETSV